VESGFKAVDRDAYTTRLLHVKGKRNVRYWEEPVAKESLNTGDVFILDDGPMIYVYNGALANKYEKLKGIEVANRVNNERGGKSHIHFIHEDPTCEAFWAHFGGHFEVTNPGGPDDAVDHVAARCFRISDAAGNGVEFTAVDLPDEKLKKSILDTNDIFLIDVGSKVFVWVGRGASPAEKRESMIHAARYLVDSRGSGATVPIERVGEGAESSLFKAEFAVWNSGLVKAFAGKAVASTPVDSGSVDVHAFLERQHKAETPVDDGSGRVEVFRVENFELQPVPKEFYGQFYGGDSYVIVYKYTKPNSSRELCIIYFWQGETSTADERGASALLAKKLDDEMGGAATQVRVVQGKEPAHFRQIFKGRMVVHSGGKASAFKNKSSEDTYDTDGVALFLVHGSSELNTYAKQVAEAASSLNSCDSFVLVTPKEVFSWNGRFSSEEEHAVAHTIAQTLASSYNGTGDRIVTTIHEGHESEEFWTFLGGKGDYSDEHTADEAAREPRLFHCSNATGVFRVEEVEQYQQEDLLQDDVFILDVFTQLFVWIGGQSNEAEQSKAFEFAQAFVNNATDGRSHDIPIVRITAGNEPLIFTSFFHGWDSDIASRNRFEDPYEKKMREMAEKKASSAPSTLPAVALKATPAKPAPEPTPVVAPVPEEVPAPAPVVAPAATAAAPAIPAASGATFSYDALKSGIPEGVDPTRKEDFLDAATFSSLFGMDKAAFAALPKWKRDAKKKELGLF
jgi:hypothetical protein